MNTGILKQVILDQIEERGSNIEVIPAYKFFLW